MSSDAGNVSIESEANYRTKRSRPDTVLLHEATLKDLLECNNPTAYHLLRERNKLLRERVSLGADEIDFDELGFISPPDSPRPYMIFKGRVLPIRGPNFAGRRCPKDQRICDVGIQTSGPIISNGVDASALARGGRSLDNGTGLVTGAKKRKRCASC